MGRYNSDFSSLALKEAEGLIRSITYVDAGTLGLQPALRLVHRSRCAKTCGRRTLKGWRASPAMGFARPCSVDPPYPVGLLPGRISDTTSVMTVSGITKLIITVE